MGYKPRITITPQTYTVVAQDWEESERGWGVRPDGLSLHLTAEDAKQFALDFCKRQEQYFLDRGVTGVPDEYTRPGGDPKPVTVNAKIYERVRSATDNHGLYTCYRSLFSAGDLSQPGADIIREQT